MTELTAAKTALLADHTIHDVGSAWMLHEDTVARAAEHGYDNLLAVYFAAAAGSSARWTPAW